MLILLALDDLCAKGLPCLAICNAETYYKSVLAAKDKAKISPKLTDKQCRKILSDDGIVMEAALQDRDYGDVVIGDPGEDDFVAVEVAPLAVEDCPGEDGEDACEGLGDQPEDLEHVRGPGLPAGASSTSFEATDAEAGDDVAIDPPGEKRPRVVVDRIPDQIEGCRIVQETTKRYARVRVLCPLSADRHFGRRPCERWRGLGLAQTAKWGQIETVGYVGCWLARCRDMDSQEAHRLYKPSGADAEEYMLARGFLENVEIGLGCPGPGCRVGRVAGGSGHRRGGRGDGSAGGCQ